MNVEYNMFRWYRAAWGRYTQADPIGLIGGLNVFRYALNNPLSYVDRDGLTPCVADPSLSNCGPGTDCCMAQCIDTLRVANCRLIDAQPVWSWMGALAGAIAGAEIGTRWGPVGIGCGAAAGGVAGGLGIPVFDAPDISNAAAKRGIFELFRSCARNCGMNCIQPDDCEVATLFNSNWEEP